MSQPNLPLLFSDYKSRLSCVSSCFSVSSSLAPHHNLARYCIQASCPADQSLPQLDCFSQCSSHVTRSVAPQDWELWASQLTTTCQDDTGPGRYHRSNIWETHCQFLSKFSCPKQSKN